jgi:hypothetical protein
MMSSPHVASVTADLAKSDTSPKDRVLHKVLAEVPKRLDELHTHGICFVKAELWWREVDIGFSLGKLQTTNVVVAGPCSEANDLLPASGFDGEGAFDEEVVVFGVVDVDDVLSLRTVGTECKFIRHPFVIGIEKPGGRVDETVTANAGLFEFIVDDPWGRDVVEFN